MTSYVARRRNGQQGEAAVEILDAQVHVWLSDRPSRPWEREYRSGVANDPLMLLHAGKALAPETLLLEMAEAGVDGCALSPVGVYGFSNRLELDVARLYPRKFCVVGWIDHTAVDAVGRLAQDLAEGMVGIRLLALREQARHDRNEFDVILRACERAECAVALSLMHPIPPGIIDVIHRFEGVNFVIDHLGLGLSPPVRGPVPEQPFVNLLAVLELAGAPNVSIKMTGVSALSHEYYPFADIWPYILQTVEAFTPSRVMWGSDLSRVSGMSSYWDATHFISEIDQFSSDELEWIYGRTLRSVFRWYPAHNIRPHGRS
jgi:predicted TIM-barrel fold metal-dependent hydrolase